MRKKLAAWLYKKGRRRLAFAVSPSYVFYAIQMREFGELIGQGFVKGIENCNQQGKKLQETVAQIAAIGSSSEYDDHDHSGLIDED